MYKLLQCSRSSKRRYGDCATSTAISNRQASGLRTSSFDSSYSYAATLPQYQRGENPLEPAFPEARIASLIAQSIRAFAMAEAMLANTLGKVLSVDEQVALEIYLALKAEGATRFALRRSLLSERGAGLAACLVDLEPRTATVTPKAPTECAHGQSEGLCTLYTSSLPGGPYGFQELEEEEVTRILSFGPNGSWRGRPVWGFTIDRQPCVIVDTSGMLMGFGCSFTGPAERSKPTITQ